MSTEVAATATAPSPASRRLIKRRYSEAPGGTDSIESFWGIELSAAKPEEQWCFGRIEDEEKDKKEKDDSDSEPDYDFMIHTLYMKMAALGKGCEKGQEQIVSVETKDKDGKTITTPILNMASGVLTTLPLNLEFNDDHKVIFRLTEGTGPVYLSGTCFQQYPEVHSMGDESMFTADDSTATDEDDEEVEDEEDDEEEVEDEESEDEEEEEEEEMETEKGGKKGKGGVKRKAAETAKASKAKRGKVESKDESEEEESEEDEDDEDYEEKKPIKKGKSPRAAKSPKGKPAKSPVVKGDKKKKQQKKVK